MLSSAPRLVPGDGRRDARILLVGEAPGENEDRLLRPFVGVSGHKLHTWWREVGLSRDEIFLDNLYPYRPPDNDLSLIADLELWAADLHRRIADLHNLYLIVPCGAVAMRALMRVDLDDHTYQIGKYRGSIMSYEAIDGRIIKMIPTIHPASIYHQRAKKARGAEKSNPGRTEKHCALDWRRIAYECTFPEVAAPQFTNYIIDDEPGLAFVEEEFDRLQHDEGYPENAVITIDIETVHDVVDCVGFSWDGQTSYTIVLRDPRRPDNGTVPRAHALIKKICESAFPKNLQNGVYDAFWLWCDEHIWLTNFIYDTSWMHHALDPVDDHDLAYMGSIFLRGEFHKDEAKHPDKMKKYANHYEAYHTYNGIDCCKQHLLFGELQARLAGVDRWTFYLTHYAELGPAILDMMLGGIGTDSYARRRRHARLQCDLLDIQDALAEQNNGVHLYAKKDLSPIKLKKFLFETLGLPPIRERGKKGQPGKITTKEVALRKMQIKYASRCGTAIQLILDHRRKLKLASFLDEAKTDFDGVMRCEYAPMTEAGRMSSRKNPWDTGGNLQNIDREVRDTFIPDRGHIFLEVDLSQAESRIVYVLSGDDVLHDLACLDPAHFDQHSYNAHMIFGSKKVVPAEEMHKYSLAKDRDYSPLGYVTKDQRYFGKRTVHGAQRGMRGEKMADELLKDDVVRTPEECQRMLDRYLAEHPGVVDYFQWIRKQILRSKKLTNSWGRVWDVSYEKMDDDLYRRAYSFLPQSEVADLLNVWGLIPVYHRIQSMPAGTARLVAQVHDSVLISCVPSAGFELMQMLHASLTRPRTYESRTGPRDLAMPCEFKIGLTWKGNHEFKTLPPRDEYNAACDAMLQTEGDDAAVRVATT